MQGLVLPLKSGVVDASGRLRRSRWTRRFKVSIEELFPSLAASNTHLSYYHESITRASGG